MEWRILDSPEQLREIHEASFHEGIRAIAVFKHSTRCGISASIKGHLEASWDFPSESLPIYYLDLITYRDISNQISTDYDVIHESPQLLLIRNGECIYHRSHHGISVEDITDQLVSN